MTRGDAPVVWLIAGTRPEAIKMAPVVQELRRSGRLDPVLVATGQHPELVDQVLAAFSLTPDLRLTLNRVDGGQPELFSQLVTGLDALAAQRPPAAVLVQGDTTSTVAGAMVAFWRKIPVVHLEAGLRSFDLQSPFPEELNRRLVTQTASLHLAPTPAAAQNLRAESIDDSVLLVTGNTVVDAISRVTDRGVSFADSAVGDVVESATRGECRLVLVTAHRRESWGEPLTRILSAVDTLLARHPDVRVLLPMHPNPAVQEAVREALAGHPRVVLTPALPYEQTAAAIAASSLVLSDSGGIQEEAPTFKVPVLVLRDTTERMEAVNAGCAKLVGTDADLIVDTASKLLTDPAQRAAMSTRANPFGDGRAAERTEQAVAWLLGLTDEVPEPFVPERAEVVQ
ncbi:non-hydrolyzing UDP-N-acetylglucosamine 2-epimerase [Amycolatopsis sp. A1MSW2902]|uniref:non-hydrolyzing UDP-N-acetylglucosamine 2-epimerase n=1 Tax=Amycolatopsis sp. A1MSW2902 TaxID=687413 RepID=UPI00307F9A79